MKKNRCTGCKEYFDREAMIRLPAGLFHNIQCAVDLGKKRQEKQVLTARNKVKKQTAKRYAEDKKKAKGRLGAKGYYSGLKSAIHRYIKHCLRKGEPCYTCGKLQSSTDTGGAFHVGHFIPASQTDPRRFMIDWLRMQCYSCNVPNSGRRVEYRLALIEEVGLEEVEWFECDDNHLRLKDQYPNVEYIEDEAARYRKLFREYVD